MKKHLFNAFVLLAVLMGSPLMAQHDENGNNNESKRKGKRGEIQTLASKYHHSGGFGAVAFRGTSFKGEGLALLGLRGGWIADRSVAIGLEVHGIVPSAKLQDILPNSEVVLLGGYGGVFVEPILFSNQVVHVTFPLVGGAGWLGYHEDWENETDNGADGLIEDDVFWYVEPGATIEVNISKVFRVGVGLSRRFTQNLELVQTKTSDFDGTNYFFTLKFGKF